MPGTSILDGMAARFSSSEEEVRGENERGAAARLRLVLSDVSGGGGRASVGNEQRAWVEARLT
jgi:hypothetical protein